MKTTRVSSGRPSLVRRTQNIKTYHPTTKLAAKHHRPLPIQRVLSPIDYQLTLPEQWKIHNVFHIDLLTPYRETEFHGPNYDRPPPDLIEGEEQYEVEQILDKCIYGRCHEPRYWSATDRYRVTLSQRKRARDVSLRFPYRFRAGQTAGNSRGHSLVQSPECGNEFNQAWESCTTTR